ncbi:MAG: tRNA guanosine(34) transglycosylase Tgt [Thermomicrobia bacterium]|nr:tRNA guanosine(34) transglycosylase Tgt [Thermomicrobia bacterium]MCA1724725.1 tRNA guanosine(34) transglycosylase Tgt [Thermomicrobia bacterium]
MPDSAFAFTIEGSDRETDARAGRFTTPHGSICTPAFMPVGTQATVKALDPDDLHAVGAAIILANAYHLSLRPGAAVIAAAGGLHRFMAWDGPILTDSGGFQVFSLGARRTVDDDGVTFRSHLDGSLRRLTPESVIALEEAVGADIIMPLDECIALPADDATVRAALHRTQRWLERALHVKRRDDQALFAIVQGGLDPDLRWEGAAFAARQEVPGIAIGGLSVGESKEAMDAILSVTTAALPLDRPRYLMGVGAPEDLWACVARGVDLFDCVLPARVARHGGLYTAEGRISIGNARYRDLHAPIDVACGCPTCRRFSAAYLHHLYRTKELLWYRLATMHNLWFILRQMEEMRAAILDGSFAAQHAVFRARYRTANRSAGADARTQFVASRKRRQAV